MKSSFKNIIIGLLLMLIILVFLSSLILNLPILLWQSHILEMPQKISTDNLILYFTLLLNIVLIIMFVLLCVSLARTIRMLSAGQSFWNRISLVYKVLIKEPPLLFANMAQRDTKGTYKAPYGKYKDAQKSSKSALRQTLVLAFMLIFTVGFLIYNFINLNNYNLQSEHADLLGNKFKITETKNQ